MLFRSKADDHNLLLITVFRFHKAVKSKVFHFTFVIGCKCTDGQ